jgi:hypothetical protein
MATKEKTVASRNSVHRAAESVVGVPDSIMRPEVHVFRLVGISPLLQNNPAAFIGKTDTDAGLQSKKVYKDDEEAAMRCYKDEEGRFCHPSQGFIKSILRAATGKKFGKASAPALIRGGVFAVESLCIIEGEDGKPATAYTIDRQSCVVGPARILRWRPSWSPWQIRLALEINVALIGPDAIRQVLALAGPTVGVGDYRPEKGGRFGRYRLAE